MTRRQMAYPKHRDELLDLTWRERGKIVAGAFIALIWVFVVLSAIFIAGASPTP